MDIPDQLGDNNLEIKPTLVEGGTELRVFHDGKQCRITLLEGDPPTRIARYQAMLIDIYKTQAYLNLALEIYNNSLITDSPITQFNLKNRDQVICSSLYISAITLYSKCFKEAKGRIVQLQDGQVKLKMSDKQYNLHKQVLELRGNWTGHGGHSNHETFCPLAVFYDSKAVVLYAASNTSIVTASSFEIFLELCAIVESIIESQKATREVDVFNGKDIQSHFIQLQEQSTDHVFVPHMVPPSPSPTKPPSKA
ncbi:hypothetical protein [Pseudomonas syringae]|jgi:hypothetical protein|uniref:hypothetical protein n=1 Tax=Pseudomonas syringae TaxID=317 RepID=UPI000A263935|nr:hypothetical protein [Pseudomonas syringae]OSR80850.1 hypothetical protein BV328_00764 [Pseudomonas syringae pv. actinidiae]